MSREKKSKFIIISEENYNKIKILLGFFEGKEFSYKELLEFIQKSENTFLKEISEKELEEGLNYFYNNDLIKEIIVKQNGKRKEVRKKKDKLNLDNLLSFKL